MSVIDRHILGEWFKALALVLGATLGILLIEDMYSSFRELLEFGASPADILSYYAILSPSLLTIVLPVSLLLSLLFSLGALHKNNEFTALRAAGLSIFRLTRGIWVVGLLLACLTWQLNTTVIPWSVESSRRFWERLEFTHEARTTRADSVGLVYDVGFDNRKAGRVWMINRISEYTLRANGVTLHELDRSRREMTRILAREARCLGEDRGWVFLDGRESWYDPATGEMTRTATFKEKRAPHYGEDPRFMLMVDRNPRDLSFTELGRLIDYLRVENNPRLTACLVRHHSLLASAAGCLVVIGLAIPFAISGVRVNPVVGVSKSIGLFFLYYVATNIFQNYGNIGAIAPWAAAWIPIGLMLIVAAWFWHKL